MNRFKILLVTTVAAAGMLFAQGQGGQAGQQGPAGPGARRAARAKLMQQRRGNRLMASYLGLTADQIAKQQAINQAANEQAKPIRQSLNQAQKDLQTAIRDLAPVDALAAQVGTLTGQLAAIRAKARQDFLRLLTPEQLQKLENLNAPRPRPAAKQ